MIKKMLINVLLLLVSLLLFFMVGEVLVRLYTMVEYDKPFSNISLLTGKSTQKSKYLPNMYMNKKVGWKVTGNYVANRILKDASGRKYNANVTTDKYGFRMFGDPGSEKIKIFFIGDSFTHALHVSDDKTYYSIIGSKLKNNVEVFAYGGGGYGSLQEYMILDEFLDIIKPDIIVWQFCSNDFINNDYELEKLSYRNNNAMRRPYLNLQDEISYMNPAHLKPPFNMSNIPVLNIIIKKSRLLRLINKRLNKLLAFSYRDITVEAKLSSSHDGFKRSLEVTRMIMKKVRNRASNLPIYVFSVDELISHDFLQLDNVYFIDGVAESINEYERRGVTTKYADGAHWNEMGHKAGAERIIEYFQENDVNLGERTMDN